MNRRWTGVRRGASLLDREPVSSVCETVYEGVGEVYERFDTPLRGLVTADGRYVYGTHEDGFRSPDGPVSADGEERLESLASGIPERAVDDEGSGDVSSDVMSQLEDLGYA